MVILGLEKDITLVRGDSMRLVMFINKGTESVPVRYTVGTNDTVYFALMEAGSKFEDAILKKIYTSSSEKTTDGDLIISLVPEDTENLLNGNYVYTIKIRQLDTSENKYYVSTLIQDSPFFIID